MGIQKFLLRHYVPLFIFILALFLRLLWLNIIPVALTNDEFDYIIQAESISFTGHTIPTNPALGLFSFGQQNQGNVLAELPSFLIAPVVGLFPSSQFASRLPYALTSSLIVVMVYFIFHSLTRNKSLSLFAALALALNPWSIHFGRTSFEFTFALFFYLLGIYLVIIQKRWKILYAVIFFVLGFLSYHGFKILIVPLVLFISIWKYYSHEEKSTKPLILLCSSSILIFFLYAISLGLQPAASRISEIVFFNPAAKAQITKEVNYERQFSIPGFQQSIFINKYVYFTRSAIQTYLNAFSTDFLFVKGDPRGAYSFWIHGPFYFIDFPLILLGFFILFVTYKRAWALVTGLILLAPLPSVISTVDISYVIRSSLMFPLLASLSGLGMWYLLQIPRKYHIFCVKYVVSLVVFLYIISVAYFLNLYFTRYPLYGSEGFFLSDKIIARYLSFASHNPNHQTIVYAGESRIKFEKYLFYNHLYTRQTANEINEKIKQHDYSWDNIKFTDTGFSLAVSSESAKTIIYKNDFETRRTPPASLSIATPTSSDPLYYINNDIVCKHSSLLRYVVIHKISDFDMYAMPLNKFCSTWITYRD